MRKDIVIGGGDIILSGIGQGDIEGIGIYAAPKHSMETNTPLPKSILDGKEPEIAIWFKDMAAVRLFQDVVSGAAMRMNGYIVENKELGKDY